MKKSVFKLVTENSPKGDQPHAISQLVKNINDGIFAQTLLGVTGSGKTFTMANVIAKLKRPTIIMAHNKTLAAQLYGEMRSLFPHNAVEYFVSYYDYYQPEAYVAASDTYISKDASINEQIEQLRLSATKSLIERKDVIVVATVSAIYGLGDPNLYMQMLVQTRVGDKLKARELALKLTKMQYTRNEMELKRGTFRMRGDVIDVYPAESDEYAIRIEIFDDEVESLKWFDPLTGKIVNRVERITVYPKTLYVTPQQQINLALDLIKEELKQQEKYFHENEKFIEEQRIGERVRLDLEMMQELGYCQGIENYSRYLSGREVGLPPPTLLDYLPAQSLMFIDESHATVPQIGAMYKGDFSRKDSLVTFGFRLPSALDNRPLKFHEFENLMPQTIFVSATPGNYELDKSTEIVEQVVRPTGLIDPRVEIRPATNQVENIFVEIKLATEKNQRILITTLTKKMAENLAEYLGDRGIRVKYLHSDIETVERIEIIRQLRLGEFDVLVGINLLREGLDIPEVALVAILDADKVGFLRSTRSLIQTIGRSARNLEGRAILYADQITDAIAHTLKETDRRRNKQIKYNQKHGIKPQQVVRQISEKIDINPYVKRHVKRARVGEQKNKFEVTETKHFKLTDFKNLAEVSSIYKKLEKQMYKVAKNLEFEQAASYRNQLSELREIMKQI